MGVLETLQPLPVMSKTPLEYSHILLSPIGSDLPVFPGSGASYDIDKVQTKTKEDVMHASFAAVSKKTEELKRIGESNSHTA